MFPDTPKPVERSAIGGGDALAERRRLYYNVTLSQTIQPLQRALTMGQIGGVVLSLYIPNALQRLVGREWLLG